MNRRSFLSRLGGALLGAQLAGLHLWGEMELVAEAGPALDPTWGGAQPVWLVHWYNGGVSVDQGYLPDHTAFSLDLMTEEEIRRDLGPMARYILDEQPAALRDRDGRLTSVGTGPLEAFYVEGGG